MTCSISTSSGLIGRSRRSPVVLVNAMEMVRSPMALSFWQECRRVRNDALKRTLGVKLLYPTYREGLRALIANANSGP